MKRRNAKLVLLSSVFALSLGVAVIAAEQAPVSGAYAEESQARAATSAKTAEDLGIADIVATTAEAENFSMTNGASVRVDRTTPGVRFEANLADEKAGVTDEYASYDFYIKFSATNSQGTNAIYVPGTPEEKDGVYTYTAALTYDDLTEDQFKAYKAVEITGQAVLVLTDAEGNKSVVNAVASDNTRTMEAVVNAAKLAGELSSYEGETLAAMNAFAPEATDYVVDSKLYIQKDAGLVEADVTAALGSAAGTLYFSNSKVDLANLNGTYFSNIAVGESTEGYLTLKNAEGTFTNVPYQTADKVIRQASDLDYVKIPATGKSTVDGYVVVATDISYAETTADTYPSYAITAYDTTGFTGTFDGDGHTVHYYIRKGGLFGSLLKGSVVKNVALVVKRGDNISADATAYWCNMFNVILARWGKQFTLENVYAKYDTDHNLYDLQYATGSIGLFGASSEGTMKNVIVDMSNLNDTETIYKYYETANLLTTHWDATNRFVNHAGLGALASHPVSSWFAPTEITNTFVFWGRQEVFLAPKLKKIAFAENDYAALESSITDGKYTHSLYGECTVTKYTGANRFNTAADSKSYFDENESALKAFAGIADISNGYPVVS